jgi:hypothetical protein
MGILVQDLRPQPPRERLRRFEVFQPEFPSSTDMGQIGSPAVAPVLANKTNLSLNEEPPCEYFNFPEL